MSAKPHSCSNMEPILGSSVCLICFQMTEKYFFIPSEAPEKLFINCNKYLHSTLTTGTLKDIELHNENQVPLCKRCFDSALELTQLSEQLTSIEKDISDLTVAFSIAVFHRRSQVYSIGQSCKTSSIVEFNEACLPPNLFFMKLGDQNIHPNKNVQEMDINGIHLQTDIANVKCEASDNQLDDLSGNPQPSVAIDDAEMLFNKENIDKQCRQSTIEQNKNLASVSEMTIVQSGENDSKECADPNDAVKFTRSELLKSAKMPKIILERIKIVGHKLDVSVGNSNQTKCEPLQKNLDETLFKDDELSVVSCAPESSGDGNPLKCFYCKKTFAQEWHRTLHHTTHTGGRVYKCPLGKQKFVTSNNQKICEVNHTETKSFYKCSYCEKEFSARRGLQNHERLHTGETPFKCSFCNKRFKQRVHWKNHERNHTGERPFKCSLCNNRFNQPSSLRRHEKTHTWEEPFKCSFCVSSFRQKYNLKVHERLHTGEKPYKCLYCEMTFTVLKDKNSHQKLHPEHTMSSLVSQLDNQKGSSLEHLKHLEPMNSLSSMEFKCSFCEMTFSHDEKRANHENIHRREDEIVNENLIVGF